MFKRGFISFVLLAVYSVAVCANGLGIMTCRCELHHHNEIHHHHHNCDHDHHHDASCRHYEASELLCNHECCLSQGCECTHSQEDITVITGPDNDRRIYNIIKYGALFLQGEVLCAVCDPCSQPSHTVLRYAGPVKEVSPDIGSGAPRAPSV